MTESAKTNKVYYPEYWAKRKNRINPELIKKLENTAQAEAVCSDKYGEYKPGIFLHKSYIVTVTRDNNVWSAHIFGEHPIGLPIIKEVRYKYLPNDVLIVYLLGDREEQRHLKGVMLYELPTHVEDVEEVAE